MLQNQFSFTSVSIKKKSKDYKLAKKTLLTAFPKKEQSPLWALRLMAKKPEVDFLAYYDIQNNYIGTSYSIHHNKTLLILYLAIDKNSRNKGYGTNLIRYLQQKDNIKETVLDIESPYQPSQNAPQRLRRLTFYQRLGFISSDQEIIEPECNYLILGTTGNQQQTVKTYKDLTARLTSNLCHLKIEPAKK